MLTAVAAYCRVVGFVAVVAFVHVAVLEFAVLIIWSVVC
jgi:hypothetical protein